jgi:hypothetical protein
MQEEINQIEEAKKAAAELRAATAELQKLLQSENKDRVKEILSGKTEAGAITPKDDPDQIIRDRCNALLKGTGLKI